MCLSFLIIVKNYTFIAFCMAGLPILICRINMLIFMLVFGNSWQKVHSIFVCVCSKVHLVLFGCALPMGIFLKIILIEKCLLCVNFLDLTLSVGFF